MNKVDLVKQYARNCANMKLDYNELVGIFNSIIKDFINLKKEYEKESKKG